MTDADRTPCIGVLAGTNGAGKSSIGGAALSSKSSPYFDPDEGARKIRRRNPRLSQRDANIEAWNQGKRLLERAIEKRLDFCFETTLGGKTITGRLERALKEGVEVRIWYVGLSSPELHIARVAARVARCGHDIPESDIRERYDNSRRNLIRLLPDLTELWVYDNSRDADPATGVAPKPYLVLHLMERQIVGPADLSGTPRWAKPIVAAAMKLQR